MRSRTLLAVVALLCTLSFAGPASAITVDVPGLGLTDFVLLAERQIRMEGGPVNITGNIGVNQPKSVTGLNESIHVGQFNQINGLALADRIFSGNAASFIAEVNTNVLTGQGNVPSQTIPASVVFPFIPDLGVLTGVSGLDFSCLTGVNNGPVNVPDGGSLTIAPGCYTNVKVGANATLTLSPSGNFIFNRVETGIGSDFVSPGGTSSVAVKGNFKSGSGSLVDGVVIRSASSVGEAISIGTNSTFNADGFAPFGAVHIRMGSTFSGEIVGRVITVEPSANVVAGDGCGCFETVTKNNGTTTLGGGINLSQAIAFFVGADCNCPGGGCTQVANLTPGQDGTVNLDTSTVGAGTYRVIAQFNTGTYCSAGTITVP